MRNQKSSFLSKLPWLLLIAMVFFSSCYSDAEINEDNTGDVSGEILDAVKKGEVSEAESHLTFGMRNDAYEIYIDRYKNIPLSKESIEIPIETYIESETGDVRFDTNFMNKGIPAVITSDEGMVTWEIDIPSEALYQLYVEYYPIAGKNSAIEREVLINGKVPFYGARSFQMSRIWIDDGDKTMDNRGNEIRATLMEHPRINGTYFSDYLGYSAEPYQLHFSKGKNTLSFRSVKEPLVVTRLILTQKPTAPSYAELASRYPSFENNGDIVKVQAEKTFEKSDQMLYPRYDRSSAATEPFHFSKIRLNTIGANASWKLPGQWISWEVDVPEEGLYKLVARARQDQTHGLRANRRVLIDGELPFKEAGHFTIDYATSWGMQVLGGAEDPYLIHLKPGRHVITFKNNLGDLGPIMRDVQNSVYTLNYAYRKLLMLTGSDPDIYRDYYIEDELPDVMQIFAEQSLKLTELIERYEAYGGDRALFAVLDRLSHMLERMYNNPFVIPRSMSEFKTNVAGMGTLINQCQEQPLEVDYIALVPENKRIPKARAGILKETWYSIVSFGASFFEDYDSVGNTYEVDEEDVVTAWMLTGRDQAQILKRMVDDTFSIESGIPVNVRLVMPDVLLPATVAGIGPDVAMQIWTSMPVDYAIRHAAADFTQFDDFDEMRKRFHPSALVPYTYHDGVYGLPETQEFQVMFYRKDIFDELGLEVPETWDELYAILADLQKLNMNFVLPVRLTVGNMNIYNGSNAYNMLLYQNGGEVFHGDGISVAFDEEPGVEAFEMWTDMYINYRLPKQYDFNSRFRTGEVPIGIQSYVMYNALSVFAPEIKGLWEFAPVPGIRKPDGTIDRSVPGGGGQGGQATIMLEQSKNKDDAWEFVKWWLSADSQERYGKELESVMGPAARHPTANREAMSRLAWPTKEYKVLTSQRKWVKGVPEVPGSYYLPRHLDNAWRMTVDQAENPRETLLEYVREINEEITSKRKEFGLKTIEDINE